MKSFWLRLLCLHEWVENDWSTPPPAVLHAIAFRLGKKVWMCGRCGKCILRDSTWLPINWCRP